MKNNTNQPTNPVAGKVTDPSREVLLVSGMMCLSDAFLIFILPQQIIAAVSLAAGSFLFTTEETSN